MEYRNTGSNSGDKKKKSVNTRGIQLMNADAPEHPGTLQLGWWDNFLTLAISPVLPESKREAGKVFDYDVSTNTALNPEKCMLLHDLIKSTIIPAMRDDKPISRSVSVGGDSLLTVGLNKFGSDHLRPYLAMHKNLNPNTFIPTNSAYYIFNEELDVVKDYDENSGAFTREGHANEFEFFVRVLDHASMELTMASGHSAKYVNIYADQNMKATMDNIATKIGAEVVGYNTVRKAYARPNLFGPGSGSTGVSGKMR